MATPRPAIVPEGPIENLNYAEHQGYAQSKMVSEHVISKAAANNGAKYRVLRIGQIVGDINSGVWNENEAIPLIIRSALTLKVLPALNEVILPYHSNPSFVPLP